MSQRIRNVATEADRDHLRARYEFIPSSSGVGSSSSSNTKKEDEVPSSSWQDRMVQRYNEGLYREYALADISRPGQIGLRWRTKQEVLDGRGERTCGNKRCLASKDLSTIEVPFAYTEAGVSKKELVKLRLCPVCLPHVVTKKSQSQQKSKRDRSVDNDDDTSSSNSSSSGTRRRAKKDHRRRRKSRKRSTDS